MALTSLRGWLPTGVILTGDGAVIMEYGRCSGRLAPRIVRVNTGGKTEGFFRYDLPGGR